MEYLNANMVLPDSLIEQIQKYIQGGYIYVPCQKERRKKYKKNYYIENRNEVIRNRHKSGDKVEALAKEFYLSVDSIKKIVYTKKDN